MSYLVLARKWRPGNFDDVVGQEHVTRTLKNAIEAERVAHAYLFTGGRGVGKTSAARILAKALNCEKGPTTDPCNECTHCREIAGGSCVDVHEIDGASNTSVDDIRDLKEGINYLPSTCRKKVYIIDEVHMLSTSAFNALLKTLEEPPPHVIFVFATTEPHKIPGTIMSRCQRFDFKRIPVKLIFEQLKTIAAKENINITEKGLMLIAREADGGMRDAQSLLDQVVSFSGDTITDSDIIDVLGIIDRTLIHDAVNAVIEKKSAACLEIVERLFLYGWDIKEFGKELLEYFRDLAVVKATEGGNGLVNATDDELERMRKTVISLDAGDLHLYFDVMSKGMEDIARTIHPKISLEMLLLKLSTLGSLRNIDELIAMARQGKSFVEKDEPPMPPTEMEAPAHVSEHPPVSAAETEEPYEIEEPPPQQEREKDWKGFVGFVANKKAVLGSILQRAHLVSFGDGEIVIAPDNDFSREKAKEEVETLKELSAQYFGHGKTFKVDKLEAGTEEINSIHEDKKKRESDQSRKLKKEAMEHPRVIEVLDVFKGEIEEIKTNLGFNE